MQAVRADAPWKGSLQEPKENDLYRVSSTYANVGYLTYRFRELTLAIDPN